MKKSILLVFMLVSKFLAASVEDENLNRSENKHNYCVDLTVTITDPKEEKGTQYHLKGYVSDPLLNAYIECVNEAKTAVERDEKCKYFRLITFISPQDNSSIKEETIKIKE